MFILGITGGIAMGKTTVAKQFASLGALVCDSDEEVHQLLRQGGAAVEVAAAAFPGTLKDGAIDRAALGKIVFHDAAKMQELEHILHPMVREMQKQFIDRARVQGAKLVILDIPLLFETQSEKRVDKVATVTCPAFIQRRRAFSRPRMTEEKFQHILARQCTDAERRARADFVIHTGFGKAYSAWQVKRIMKKLCVR